MSEHTQAYVEFHFFYSKGSGIFTMKDNVQYLVLIYMLFTIIGYPVMILYNVEKKRKNNNVSFEALRNLGDF